MNFLNSDCLWAFADDIGLFIRSIAPTLFTLALGGYFLNKFFIRRANMAGSIDLLCKKMELLSDECALYWSQDYSNTKCSEFKIHEAKIKGLLTQMNSDIAFIGKEYGVPVSKMPTMLIELNDLCTGGLFETKKRKADTNRYLKIVNFLGDVSAIIRHNKI